MRAHLSARIAPRLMSTLALAALVAWAPASVAQTATKPLGSSANLPPSGIATPATPPTRQTLPSTVPSTGMPAYNNGSSDSASKAYGGCTVASQRDASCLGWSGADGTRNTDNGVLSTDPRGANARRVPGMTMPSPSVPNSCVTMAVNMWSWLGSVTSFVTQAGSGFLGSGGSAGPDTACASPTDGSCVTWVPASHKFLFLGGSSFVECGNSAVSGSVSCPVNGSNALVTTNPNAEANFQAYIIACRTGAADPGVKVNDAPFSWWSNCSSGGTSCSYVVYDPNPASVAP